MAAEQLLAIVVDTLGREDIRALAEAAILDSSNASISVGSDTWVVTKSGMAPQEWRDQLTSKLPAGVSVLVLPFDASHCAHSLPPTSARWLARRVVLG